MKILDCTLRDGANVVGNGFDAETTESIVRGLLDHGIRDVELGNAKGLSAGRIKGGASPLTDREYMELVQPFLEQGRLGMFQMARYADRNDIHMAKEMGLHFLRVGANAGDGKGACEAVRMVKEEGLFCRYSLMKAYVLTPEELAEEAAMLEKAGVDGLTVMDSAGTMLPEEATAYVRALKEAVSVPVGFHGHSNLGLAQANALAAVEAGADEIDGGLLGMARSAGNCATELAVAALQRKGKLEDVDFYGLLDYLEQDLIPRMKAWDYQPAVEPTELILGLAGCHSSTLPVFTALAKERGVPLRRLIAAVSAVDRKSPSEMLIRKTADRLSWDEKGM